MKMKRLDIIMVVAAVIVGYVCTPPILNAMGQFPGWAVTSPGTVPSTDLKPIAVITHPKSTKVEKPSEVHLPSVNPPAITSDVTVVQPTKAIVTTSERESKMDWFDIFLRTFAVVGAVVFVVYLFNHGVKPAGAKVASWFTVLKSDFTALVARVENLETTVAGTAVTPTVAVAAKASAVKAATAPAAPAAPATPAATPAA